jgi:hypothetical protein
LPENWEYAVISFISGKMNLVPMEKSLYGHVTSCCGAEDAFERGGSVRNFGLRILVFKNTTGTHEYL